MKERIKSPGGDFVKILKNSAVSALIGCVCAVLTALAVSAVLGSSDRPETLFETASYTVIVVSSAVAGISNRILQKGKNKYSGVICGAFMALAAAAASLAAGGKSGFAVLKMCLFVLTAFAFTAMFSGAGERRKKFGKKR